MIRQPIGVRLDAQDSLRESIRRAAALGAKGVVLDASGDLHPDRLTDTGRREIRHLLASVELGLIALHLPTRTSYDHLDQLDVRLRKADQALTLAYDLGTRLVLVRPGGLPPEGEADAERRSIFSNALVELAKRADHRGVRLAVETVLDPGSTLRPFLDSLGLPALAASVDPGSLLMQGIDPIASARDLGPWLAHAYATDAASSDRTARIANPRGSGFPPGALDWEEYLGALEEIHYRGYLTAWPAPGRLATDFPSLLDRLKTY